MPFEGCLVEDRKKFNAPYRIVWLGNRLRRRNQINGILVGCGWGIQKEARQWHLEELLTRASKSVVPRVSKLF
jgi:hypothetical protein